MLYQEHYSKRENLIFIGIAERNVMVLYCTLQEHENKKIVYKFIEEEMKISNPCDSIEFQIIHRVGKTKYAGPGPMIARFLCYADHEISTFNFKTAIIISHLIFLMYPTISHFS